MHPAHVPLEAEAEPAEVRGPGDARPRRRLLGDRDGARDPLVGGGVHLLEERDRLEVLAAAVHVRRPLARLAGVVEVEHRGDAVDAQAVGVELLEPEQRVGDQEVAHLLAAEVEDVGAPLLVPAALRVGVLVERACRRSGPAPTRRSRSGRAPSRGSRRCRPGAAGRSAAAARRGRRSGRPAAKYDVTW